MAPYGWRDVMHVSSNTNGLKKDAFSRQMFSAETKVKSFFAESLKTMRVLFSLAL